MFELFRRKQDLKATIAALNAMRTPENKLAFEKALTESTLYVAAENVPNEWENGTVLGSEINIPILTSDAPGGGIALLCFTDIDEVRARTGQDSCYRLRLNTINELVTRHGYVGIIVNPCGPWAGLPASELMSLVASVQP